MTANATTRAIRSFVRKTKAIDSKLNILTFTAHERYESNLCKTGHNFYAFNPGQGSKTWDTDYAAIPENYHIIDEIPDYIDFDLVLAHTIDDRFQIAYATLCQMTSIEKNKLPIPVLYHVHVLPDVRFNVEEQVKYMHSAPIDQTSFIFDYNRAAWGHSKDTAKVIEHGIDTDFWKPLNLDRENVCLSVVNDWPNRDWCCGWELWKNTIGIGTQNQLPISVWGKSPGLSEAASDVEHLRKIYSSSKIFYNTSLHSPVPTVLMEAMACGCAIVSTNNCAIPSLIKHGENGLLSNDPNELRGYLELLLQNDAMAEQLGEQARNTIVNEYSVSRFIENWNDLIYSTVANYRN